MCVLVAQLCPTLCNIIDCSPPGSSVHGILQARVLEWVVISFSRGIFPTQGLDLGLPQCSQILYHLSHQGNPLGRSFSRLIFSPSPFFHSFLVKTFPNLSYAVLGLLEVDDLFA